MPTHHAIMVVDVQRAFNPPKKFVEKVERYSLRFSCRIFTRFLNPSGSMFRRVLQEKSCAPGSIESELLIPRRPGDLIFEKLGRYGLTGAQLGRLHRRKIRQVTVCGLDTDACVLAVMFSLFDAGIECHLEPSLSWSSTGLHREALAIARTQFKPAKGKGESR